MTSQKPDYYAVLGVGTGASAADVDRAYRRAARATHPDVHPDDASAAERFRAVSVAYEILSNPQRRASYDRSHPSISSGAAVRVVVHGRASAAPAHLGRRQPARTPLRPFAASPTALFSDDVFDLAEALARMLSGGPFR